MMNSKKPTARAILNELRSQDCKQFFIDLVAELGEEREGDTLDDMVESVLYDCYDDTSAQQDLVQQAFNAGWDAGRMIP